MSIQSTINNTFDHIEWSVRNIDVCQNRFEEIPVGEYEDVFGSFTVVKSGLSSYTSRAYLVSKGIYRFKYGTNSELKSVCIGTYVDYSHSECQRIRFYGTIAISPDTLILPEKCSYPNGMIIRKSGDFASLYPPRIYLAKDWMWTMSANWMDGYNDVYVKMDCPEGATSLPAFSTMKVSQADLHRMIGKLGTVTNNISFIVSEDNLSRISDAYQNMLAEKGYKLTVQN